MSPAIYKLRAECSDDIDKLRELVDDIDIVYFKRHKIGDQFISDCTIEFTTKLMLKDIRSVIAKIEDGHVMRQTVQPIDLYTGERDYLLDESNLVRACGYGNIDEVIKIINADSSILETEGHDALENAILEKRGNIVALLLTKGLIPSELNQLYAKQFNIPLQGV